MPRNEPQRQHEILATSMQKTHHILSRIEEEMGWSRREKQAYAALRVVLHTFRDRLTVGDAVHFATQLPLIIKGIYFDGWNPDIVPIKMNRAEFIDRIRQEFTFDMTQSIEELIQVIMGEIFLDVDPAEVDKIMLALPKDIAAIFC